MRTFADIPQTGRLVCESVPRTLSSLVGRKIVPAILCLVTVPLALWSLYVVVTERDMFLMALPGLIGLLLVAIFGIYVLFHRGSRGTRVIVDFDDRQLAIQRVRRNGDVARQLVVDFDDVLDAIVDDVILGFRLPTLRIERSLIVRLRSHRTQTFHEVLRHVLAAIGRQNEPPPLHRRVCSPRS